MQNWLDSGLRLPGRSFGNWRIAVSAWLIAIALAVLFIGAHGLASRNGIFPREDNLAGAVIPHHDPGFAGPDEVAASDWLERAKAEAYTGW